MKNLLELIIRVKILINGTLGLFDVEFFENY